MKDLKMYCIRNTGGDFLHQTNGVYDWGPSGASPSTLWSTERIKMEAHLKCCPQRIMETNPWVEEFDVTPSSDYERAEHATTLLDLD